jgi:hypothetical protein
LTATIAAYRLSVTLTATLLLSLGCRSVGPEDRCPFDLHQVLSQCGLRDVVPLQPAVWRRMADQRPWKVESIALIGRHAEQYVLIAASRSPQYSNRFYANWSVIEISILSRTLNNANIPREDWVIGKREFANYPTEQELNDFLRYIEWDNHQGFHIEVEGRQKLKQPPKQ